MCQVRLSASEEELFDQLVNQDSRPLFHAHVTDPIKASRILGQQPIQTADGVFFDLPRGSVINKAANNHLIIAPGLEPTCFLARSYARALSRPIVNAPVDPTQLHCLEVPRSTATFTIFVPLGWRSFSEWLEALHHILERRFKYCDPIVGVIAGASLSELSWFALKQLASRHNDETTLWVTDALCRLRNTSANEDVIVAEARTAMSQPHGALYLSSHSRAHCGRLNSEHGYVGICGSPTRGEHGLCVYGRTCAFAETQVIPLEELNTTRVFYNGCLTAQFAAPSHGIPAAALLSLSAARGQVVEFIGNTRLGRYSYSDLQWFSCLSSVGFTGSEAVALLRKVRGIVPDGGGESLVFCGDAISSRWPSDRCAAAQIEDCGNSISISWKGNGAPKAARVPGDNWAQLARRRMLNVTVYPKSATQKYRIGVVDVPWTNETVVALLLRVPEEEYSQPPTVVLKPRRRPISLDCGRQLARCLDQIRFLKRCPIFASLAEIETKLMGIVVSLRRTVNDIGDQGELEQRATSARSLESDSIYDVDKHLVETACAAAAHAWNWEDDYDSQVESIYIRSRVCRLCGRATREYALYDWLTRRHIRTQISCDECGLVADLPRGLAGCLDGAPDFDGSKAYQDHFVVKNRNGPDRVVVARLQVNGKVSLPATSCHSVRIRHSGQETMPVTFYSSTTLSGFGRVRVYFSSEGEFGYVGRPYFF